MKCWDQFGSFTALWGRGLVGPDIALHFHMSIFLYGEFGISVPTICLFPYTTLFRSKLETKCWDQFGRFTALWGRGLVGRHIALHFHMSIFLEGELGISVPT